MGTYNYDFDLCAIVLHLIVILTYLRSKHLNNAKSHIFIALLLFSFLTPVTDIISGYAIEHQLAGWFVQFITLAYYLTEQGATFCFFMYVCVQLEMRKLIPALRKTLMATPIFWSTAAIITNPIHGLLFSYENGVYTSGPFRVITYVIPYIYFLWGAIYCTKNKDMLDRKLRILMYIITVINLFPMLIQYFVPSLLIHSFAVSISVFMLFLTTENNQSVLDQVTGLANRSYLAESVTKMMYNKFPFTSILVRIADYDLMTTSYGIRNTEKMMVAIAKYLRSFVYAGNAFQINNSCFVLNLTFGRDPEEMKKKIYEGLNRVWTVDSIEMVCSSFVTSISYPENCPTRESYRAYLTYFQKMHRMRYGIVPTSELGIKDKIRENQVELAIERAVQDQSFEVYFQPICTNADRKFMTAEALVRLTDSELGTISPAEFIPLAESNGTIIHIGDFVLEQVCKFIASHDMDALGLHYLEMNLSTIQCLQRNFMETVDKITAKYQVPSHYICFEITETASNCSPAIFSDNLQQLKKRGYLLALDDFGTGYANLQRMITSDFDLVKFDKEMTQRACNDFKLHELFEKLLLMFHSLNIQVVAEGVETKEQFDFLKTVGNDYIQGFYFSPAIKPEEFVRFLEDNMKS